MGQTFAQKVLGRAAGREVQPGDTVSVEPDLVLTHDNSSEVLEIFRSTLPGGRVKYPSRLAIVLDHSVPAANREIAAGHSEIRKFVNEQDIKHFFDTGCGICHQVVTEQHLALPGSIVMGSPSHTCTYGALNAFAAGTTPEETAGIWSTGKTEIKVPESLEINLQGHFQRRVSAKDLILSIIGSLGSDGARGMALEFHGSSLGSILIDERLTMANMGVEMGALISVFPADRITQNFLFSPDICSGALWSDADASFVKTFDFDLDEIVPVVARPHSVDNVCPAKDLPVISVDQVYIGTCTNGRIEDLKAALAVMKGRMIAPGVRLIVGTASRDEYVKALQQGVFEAFAKAGAVIIPPGCGPCMGAHQGVLSPGEVCFSTANRNYAGRMGDREAEIYLGSPETAAATAVTGVITDPREV